MAKLFTAKPAITFALEPKLHILSVSPFEEDHRLLEEILTDAEFREANHNPRLFKVRGLMAAQAVLNDHGSSIVICEHDLHPGSWKDLLRYTSGLSDPPYLILTSRLANDVLWAEALNLGAFDVLAKPFEKREVLRIVKSACLRRKLQLDLRDRNW